MEKDIEHLKLLSVFHYVVGGILSLFSLFPIFHLLFGLIFLIVPQSSNGVDGPPPAIVGWIFIIISGSMMMFGWTIAALIAFAGRCLARQKFHMYCLVVAGIECLFMPLGTVLGVFTIIVLMRDSVKELFENKDSEILNSNNDDYPN